VEFCSCPKAYWPIYSPAQEKNAFFYTKGVCSLGQSKKNQAIKYAASLQVLTWLKRLPLYAVRLKRLAQM